MALVQGECSCVLGLGHAGLYAHAEAHPTVTDSVRPALLLSETRFRSHTGRKDPNEIWASDELQEDGQDDVDDGRRAPEYEFAYKQAVQTTDAFLGMDPMGKDPTSTSCEDLVLHVTLPEASSAAEVDVDLKPTRVTVRTNVQCASLRCPHLLGSSILCYTVLHTSARALT